MKKRKKDTVFISKIRGTKVKNEVYFWYQVNHGVTREVIKGTREKVAEQREALIEKYKLDYIKLGS